MASAQRALERCGAIDVVVDTAQNRLAARATSGLDGLARLVAELHLCGADVVDVGVRRASLDEVFAALTSSPSGRAVTAARAAG